MPLECRRFSGHRLFKRAPIDSYIVFYVSDNGLSRVGDYRESEIHPVLGQKKVEKF